MQIPRRFPPIPNVQITCANCPQQAEKIVNFLNQHHTDLGVTFHIQNSCIVVADRIKESRIAYIQGVIAGYLLNNK